MDSAPDHVVVVDASFRDGWAGLAAVAENDADLWLVRRVVQCRGSSAAESSALAAAGDAARGRGWEHESVLFLTDHRALRRLVGPRGWRLEWVPRHRVHVAHVAAKAELRTFFEASRRSL